jgi:hypothetical protein
LERVKTAVEFTKDCNNISRCETNIRCFNRGQALVCLQDMIQEYESQIKTFGLWIDRVRVVHGVPLEQFSDMHIQNQLQYIASHIPVYVLLREGEKELAKRICQWLDGSHSAYD